MLTTRQEELCSTASTQYNSHPQHTEHQPLYSLTPNHLPSAPATPSLPPSPSPGALPLLISTILAPLNPALTLTLSSTLLATGDGGAKRKTSLPPPLVPTLIVSMLLAASRARMTSCLSAIVLGLEGRARYSSRPRRSPEGVRMWDEGVRVAGSIISESRVSRGGGGGRETLLWPPAAETVMAGAGAGAGEMTAMGWSSISSSSVVRWGLLQQEPIFVWSPGGLSGGLVLVIVLLVFFLRCVNVMVNGMLLCTGRPK